MHKFYSFLLFALLVFAGCTTATKAYNKGDYADAVEKGVKKLQKDPADTHTKELVKSAYTFAVMQGEAAIRSLSASGNDNRYEAILRQYNRLQELYETINTSPAATAAIRPTNYSEYVQTYSGKVADMHISNAERWMAKGTKRAYREAYNEYTIALRYQNTEALKQLRDEAYKAALTKILVVPIQNYGSSRYHTDFQLQQFQHEVMRTLAYNLNDGFVRFYSDWDLRSKDLQPDKVLEMNLGRIRIGQPYDENTVREVSKQVVVKETVYKPDSVVKQYATVRARIVTTHRTLVSEGDLYMTIRDIQGRILWTDRFTGQHRWQASFATYTGDERALSENDGIELNQKAAYNPPREEEIMRELYRQIQLDLSSRLRGYFARF